jgi:hypothetical protein
MTTEVQKLNDYADIKSQDKDGRTPLSRAGQGRVCGGGEAMLEQNADVDARDNDWPNSRHIGGQEWA